MSERHWNSRKSMLPKDPEKRHNVQRDRLITALMHDGYQIVDTAGIRLVFEFTNGSETYVRHYKHDYDIYGLKDGKFYVFECDGDIHDDNFLFNTTMQQARDKFCKDITLLLSNFYLTSQAKYFHDITFVRIDLEYIAEYTETGLLSYVRRQIREETKRIVET